MKKFQISTPAPKKSKLNWKIQDLSAEIPASVEVKVSEATRRPYFKWDLPGCGQVVCCMVDQFMSDTEQCSVKYITSKEGEDIEVNEDVKIGIKDGVFFTI